MKQITARKIFALLLSFVGILFLATSCAKSMVQAKRRVRRSCLQRVYQNMK